MDNIKKIDRHTITISHLDKTFFPKSLLTKQDVIEYYEKISPYFLRHVQGYLIVMQRFPNGIAKEGFFQKQISDYFPSWIKRKTVNLKKNEQQSLILINTSADLVYLANQAVLVYHSWLSKDSNPTYPQKIVFDIDPSHAAHESSNVKALRFAARALKKIVESHNLVPFIMTTGSRGYHVVVPLVPEHTFEQVHVFAKHIASTLAAHYPERMTVEPRISERKGRIFIDYLRNSFGQTSVACYSLRALEGAPVATPIAWDELGRIKPQQYTLRTIFKRLARKGDAWKNFEKSARRLS